MNFVISILKIDLRYRYLVQRERLLDLYVEVHFYPIRTGSSIKNSVPSPGVEKHFS